MNKKLINFYKYTEGLQSIIVKEVQKDFEGKL